jgi:hypothetical protein
MGTPVGVLEETYVELEAEGPLSVIWRCGGVGGGGAGGGAAGGVGGGSGGAGGRGGVTPRFTTKLSRRSAFAVQSRIIVPSFPVGKKIQP